MSLIKRVLDPIAAAEAAAIKASRTHEAGLAAIASANDQVREVKRTLALHASDKEELASALIEEATTLKAAGNLLAVGQSDTQVREVFAPVK